MANWNALNPSGEEEFNAMRPREVKSAEPLTRDQAASAIHKIIGRQVIVNVPEGMTAQITFVPIESAVEEPYCDKMTLSAARCLA